MAHQVRKAADQALLQALACGATVENAARKAGMSERTAYRRLADPAFVQRWKALRADMEQRTAGLLTGAGMASVKTLVDLQNDVTVPAGVRRRSARDVLELGLKFRETTAGAQHLAAVEDLLVQAIAARVAQTIGQRPGPAPAGHGGSDHEHTAEAPTGSPPAALAS